MYSEWGWNRCRSGYHYELLNLQKSQTPVDRSSICNRHGSAARVEFIPFTFSNQKHEYKHNYSSSSQRSGSTFTTTTSTSITSSIPLYRQISFNHSLFPTKDESFLKNQKQVHRCYPAHLSLVEKTNYTKKSRSNQPVTDIGKLIFERPEDKYQRNLLSQRLLNRKQKSLYSNLHYFRNLFSDEMGWTQPVVGKRPRQSESDENENNGNGETESSTDDMKGTFNKKPRELSPKRSPGIMDFNNESNIHRIPLMAMSMGCELSNRTSSDTTVVSSNSSFTTTTSSESDTCQGSSLSPQTQQYSYFSRPEFPMRRSRERSGGDESPSNTNLKSLSLADQISSSDTSQCSQDEVDGIFPSVNPDTMPVTIRYGRVPHRNPPSPRARANGLNHTKKYNSAPSTASSSDSSTTITSQSSSCSTETSETTSEATEVETDYDDKAEDLLEDEGDDLSESTDFMPPFQVPTKIVPAIRPSYFPHVPPYINFCLHDQQCDGLPSEIKKYLKWRLSPITPNVIKKTVNNTGFRLLRKTVEWKGQWGKHMKAALFRTALKDYQKLNHLPATFQIGRKDRLWRNFHRFMLKFGREEFGFLPRTYVLPQEIKQLKQAWDSSETKGRPWIVKPPAAARGTGIRVVNKWTQIPKKRSVIVQKYISNPLLINERKFDLRLYVLVTSFHPLKVYLYNDGLVRFAPVKYSHDAKRVSDRFMHLTNYSVNKNCELYTQNEDADSCKGHKWTLKTLWRHLREEGKNIDKLWEQIEDIVIKTLLCAEDAITAASFSLPNRYNGYELFGFDIILDHKLKPHLLEVNISPSLHSSSPLDLAVKGALVKEVFNIVGYHLPSTLSPSAKKLFKGSVDVDLDETVFDKRLYTCIVSKEERIKHQTYKSASDNRQKYLSEIIKTLTPDDVRQLITAEDELGQCQNFTRIFPTPTTHQYFPFIDGPRYYNLLMDAWENAHFNDRSTGIERIKGLCRTKMHLQVTTSSKNSISETLTNTGADNSNNNPLGPNLFVDTEISGLASRRDGVGDNVFNLNEDNKLKFSPGGLSNNCHDEALASVNRNTNPSPGTDYIKGVCAS